MKQIGIILSLVAINLLIGCTPKTELTVMQFNIWQEGTVVEGGFNAIIDEIIRSDADLIALSEVRNYKETNLAKRLVEALNDKGHTYYAQKSQDTGILSRFPIRSQNIISPVEMDHRSITKAIIDVDGTEIAFYSAHLDYLNCSLYLPRGYDGNTWEKLDNIVTDTALIAKNNLESMRDESHRIFLEDSKKERENGRIVIYAGDFNEPSHLDWTEATKDLFDHNGVVMPWQNTINLEKAGFIDTYREKFPNPVTHPGFTFPADNRAVPLRKLVWSPDADDRDRIDFIFYHKDDNLKLETIQIVGPEGDIVRNKRVVEKYQDPILTPVGIWPTDHKAVLATFTLK